jgi:site-specific DNA-cytosine methylase
MNILSLFDGISCCRVALSRVSIPVNTYYASEIDKHAITIAQKNFPDTQRYKCLGNGWTVDVIAHIFKNIA